MIPFHPHAPPMAPLEREVVDAWRASGRTEGTISLYRVSVRHYYAYCSRAGLDPFVALTRAGALGFAAAHVGQRTRRHLSPADRVHVGVALRAWSYALRALGHAVPPWNPRPPKKPLPALLAEYRQYRLHHAGVAAATLDLDVETASRFLAFLRSGRRRLGRTRVAELDGFVTAALGLGWARRTVSTMCSSLRSFLRFLLSTGRLREDLASSVVAPLVSPMERPPRALPWPDVRRLVRAARQDRAGRHRAHAVILLMATYGIGAAELMRIRLEDIDWFNRILCIHRPKTGVQVLLPLLPSIAEALAAYIQHERPAHAKAREVFVCRAIPHKPITSSGSIYYLLQKYARAAGVRLHGCHVLRHSHASRQVDAGANPKVLSDILGHRHPASTSVYVRVALGRLRQAALPVP